MATRRISSLLSRSFISSPSSSLSSLGRNPGLSRTISRFSTAAVAAEEPVSPNVQVEHTNLFINGNFVDAASGKTFPTLDPRTGEVIAHVAEADLEDINRAVAAARKAFDEGPWPKMSGYERSRIMFRFADLLEKHSDELATLETWDNGKPFSQAAQAELPMIVRIIRYYAGWADKIHGLTVPADGPHHVQTLHEPIGVAGQIIPWNFPLLMFSWKIGPALATGNTVVIKSAEQTPLSAIYAAKLLQEVDPSFFLNQHMLQVPRTHEGLLKWKYSDSVDFLFEVTEDHQEILSLKDGRKRKTVDGRVFFGNEADPSEFSGKIIECTWNPKERLWVYLRVRIDKSNPNEFNTYMKVMRSINDNITEDFLLVEIHRIVRLPMYADRIKSDSEAHTQPKSSGRHR